jgi:hypothetical protein
MIPTITLMSTLPPMVLLLLKGLLVLPPVSIVLSRVRSGAALRRIANISLVLLYTCEIRRAGVGQRDIAQHAFDLSNSVGSLISPADCRWQWLGTNLTSSFPVPGGWCANNGGQTRAQRAVI